MAAHVGSGPSKKACLIRCLCTNCRCGVLIIGRSQLILHRAPNSQDDGCDMMRLNERGIELFGSTRVCAPRLQHVCIQSCCAASWAQRRMQHCIALASMWCACALALDFDIATVRIDHEHHGDCLCACDRGGHSCAAGAACAQAGCARAHTRAAVPAIARRGSTAG